MEITDVLSPLVQGTAIRGELSANETLVAQQQVARLQALLEASRQLHSTIDLDTVLRIALEIVVRELELTGAFFSTFQHAYGAVTSEVRDSILAGIAVADGGAASAALRFPLCDKAGTPFSELIVLLPQDRILDLDETDFLESLAVQAAVAIENARFHTRALQWQRVESDLAAARQVQLSLVPRTMPRIPAYNIAARTFTCYEVGGDYLDIVSLPSGEVVMVVADVAGKGLASALVGASFRSAVRAMVHAQLSLYEIATKMNLLHYEEGNEARQRYVTAIFLRLEPRNHALEVLNAGHNPAFLMGGDGQVTKISASGTPIGLLPSSTYRSQTLKFLPGMRLLVYTDGMTEVFRGEDEFGEARLLDAFVASGQRSPDDVLDSLWATLNGFCNGRDQSDDMTALALFRSPDGEAIDG